MTDLSRARWRKSSYSTGSDGGCVEIATNIPGVTAIRDSKNPAGGALIVPAAVFASFLAQVTRGRRAAQPLPRIREAPGPQRLLALRARNLPVRQRGTAFTERFRYADHRRPPSRYQVRVLPKRGKCLKGGPFLIGHQRPTQPRSHRWHRHAQKTVSPPQPHTLTPHGAHLTTRAHHQWRVTMAKAVRVAGLWYHDPVPRPAAARVKQPR
jgi:Domain of unknown function (DUF397)